MTHHPPGLSRVGPQCCWAPRIVRASTRSTSAAVSPSCVGVTFLRMVTRDDIRTLLCPSQRSGCWLLTRREELKRHGEVVWRLLGECLA